MSRVRSFINIALTAVAISMAVQASAQPALLDSGKLLLNQGISTIEGSSGGGLASWATVAGYETGDGIGANAHETYVDLNNYTLQDFGASVGLFNRVELSYTREAFDTGAAGGKLGLGRNFTFDQDVYGAKVRLIGDLVYDQDSWRPQIAAGVQYKVNDRDAIIHAVGGKSAQGTDYYVSGTKLFLAQSLVVDATLRLTKANQTGLLGFGGDKSDRYAPEFEGSLGYLLTRRLVVGGEYRTKPDNLGFAKEDAWWDLFTAYAIDKHLSITAAYTNLGDIATFRSQNGVLISLQAGL